MTKTKLDYKPYPKNDGYRGGCKVSWLYYSNPDDAYAASQAAKHNARIMEGLGFDFGYCAPGSVTQMREGEHAGMAEVCIP